MGLWSGIGLGIANLNNQTSTEFWKGMGKKFNEGKIDEKDVESILKNSSQNNINSEDFSEISALIKKMEAAKANANSNNGADFSSLKEKYKLHSSDEFFSFANKKVKGVNKSKKNKESSRR
ncbi:hypothetical protein CAUP111243_05405 [Campylobacter upsaliensis]|uniref:Uncharacterized protein n=1 Tax=Campylobacter upsaliensis TaxID=28080 RepID=A0A3S4UT65_CAMUP|nr:hypothetical protein [Campylobacter upsaliensis]MCA5589282.1 hypothetical protein [Campylobacter upsaliensis]VEG85535.1 Uncharacterised protein [Campylobacter upsaliensis]